MPGCGIHQDFEKMPTTSSQGGTLEKQCEVMALRRPGTAYLQPHFAELKALVAEGIYARATEKRQWIEQVIRARAKAKRTS